jgi:hypothetical protein
MLVVMSKITTLLTLVALATGCVDVEPDLASDSEALQATNGVRLNGVRLNGVRLNGVSLNGVRLNGVRLNGVRLNGVRLNGVSLVGSQITAIEGGVPQDLIGSRWDGVLSDGTVLPLRIDSITRGVDANRDVYMYRITYQTGTGWSDLCDPTAGSPTLSIAVPGTWNYDEGVPGGGAYEQTSGNFTFACRGVAIAKCVEMGYKPWTGYATYLATCTRTLRGDFCGDGRPYTVDGTTINIYDSARIELDTQAWELEAEWSPNGAECISAARLTRFYQTVLTRPTCLPTLQQKVCPGFGSTTKIKTELPPVL